MNKKFRKCLCCIRKLLMVKIFRRSRYTSVKIDMEAVAGGQEITVLGNGSKKSDLLVLDNNSHVTVLRWRLPILRRVLLLLLRSRTIYLRIFYQRLANHQFSHDVLHAAFYQRLANHQFSNALVLGEHATILPSERWNHWSFGVFVLFVGRPVLLHWQ